ncbi:uncharacterized protein BT62DRAFT_1001745 [Guyanagaster necrorhizus]|uniref:Uncharacterized protein n=1 Tax=Guyanagaster necrorhizus TaxID=856835 RepID=A0A9P7W2M6_9AGAR|nr:uncharacterized protein BT62DRAFT_1001745 [Guyanagaster necrorhizus MCA 3950]KAG7450899.1 hypothetical protein BT62DRAFT_1001745 [Guyanagaster necrorhizus MCA 3950]
MSVSVINVFLLCFYLALPSTICDSDSDYTCTDTSCSSESDSGSSVPVVQVVVGVVVGFFALFALILFFSCWRQNRIRDFQQTYVRNAQAQTLAVQQVQENHEAELNAQCSNYPPPYNATAQGWQPVLSQPEPAHEHQQAHPQRQISLQLTDSPLVP